MTFMLKPSHSRSRTPMASLEAPSAVLPIILGSTAEGASSDAIGVLLREWLGFNMKVIPGYTDSGVLFLAIERGEVEGRTVGLSSVRANKPDWLKPNGLGRVMVVFGRSSRLPDYPDIPMARELAKSP